MPASGGQGGPVFQRSSIVAAVLRGDLINLEEATQILETSRPTLRKLINRGSFTVYENPLDQRETLLSREEVEEVGEYRKRSGKTPTTEGKDSATWQERTGERTDRSRS